jgi:ribosomal protein S18 acetylase RimI-like enzyme
MNESSFHVRSMSRAEVDRIALEWAAREGWNPGLHDADSFFAADPTGFLVGLLDDEPVSAISVVKYPGSFAFLGCYIVRPEFRGCGFGWKTWTAGMQTVGGWCVGLDGVVAQQANYRKSGFELSHRNVRYAGRASGAARSESQVMPLADRSLDEIVAYDRGCFPAERREFLRRWICQPDANAVAAVQNDAIVGFGVIRACREGYKVGPLFAESAAIADRVYQELSGSIPAGSALYLDVPEVNRAAVEMAERYAMKPVFETARMYAGGIPAVDWKRVFGVTTFELG